MRTHKIVKVEWDDIACYPSWSDKDELKDYEPLGCVSTGVLAKVKRGNIGLVQTVSGNNKRAEVLVIPRKNVKSIEVLTTFRS